MDFKNFFNDFEKYITINNVNPRREKDYKNWDLVMIFKALMGYKGRSRSKNIGVGSFKDDILGIIWINL